ncbi:hypothetical protein ATE84_2199 [Aquimarina sp. MAR_2010_214]|nr:hypothetical protein ATE84_2199 [Aquimarina sp. MAR_2010_214]
MFSLLHTGYNHTNNLDFLNILSTYYLVRLFLMKIRDLKNYITYIFIVIFLSLKVAGLHVLTHEDDGIEHCKICDLVSITNFTPVTTNDTTQNYVSNTFEFYTQKNVIDHYNFVYSSDTNITRLFSRPPPYLA